MRHGKKENNGPYGNRIPLSRRSGPLSCVHSAKPTWGHSAHKVISIFVCVSASVRVHALGLELGPKADKRGLRWKRKKKRLPTSQVAIAMPWQLWHTTHALKSEVSSWYKNQSKPLWFATKERKTRVVCKCICKLWSHSWMCGRSINNPYCLMAFCSAVSPNPHKAAKGHVRQTGHENC